MPGVFGGLFGGGSQPSGSSGTGTGPTANVYTPYNQPAQDVNYNNVLGQFQQAAQTGLPDKNPAAYAYNNVTPLVYQNLVDNSAAMSQALQGAQTGAGYGATGAAGLQAGAGSVLQNAMDPQNALFGRLQQQNLDQAIAANNAAGVGSTPYGAGLTSQALGNFDTNWQNQQLQRQIQGLASAQSAYPTAAQLAAQSANLPYGTGAQFANNALSGLTSLTNLGQGAFQLPQQTLNDLQSYLQLGQAASGISGQLGNLGLNQASQGLAGLGSLVGGAGGIGGLGGLIGSGPSLSVTDALGNAVDAGSAAATDFSAGTGSGVLGFLGSLFA